MMQTLKERADEILELEKLPDDDDSLLGLSSFEAAFLHHSDKVLQLAKDQQARIEELEAQNEELDDSLVYRTRRIDALGYAIEELRKILGKQGDLPEYFTALFEDLSKRLEAERKSNKEILRLGREMAEAYENEKRKNKSLTEMHESVNQTNRSLIARLAKTQWKPIADMSEELKDGRRVLLKTQKTERICEFLVEHFKEWQICGTGFYFKNPTHYMELPE